MFWASGELRAHSLVEPIVAVPLGIGAASFIALLLVEYHKDEALAPVKLMWSTISVAGTLIAMPGGGVFVTLLQLFATLLINVEKHDPLGAGLKFWPQVISAIVAALPFGHILRTRFIVLFVVAGMMVLIAGRIFALIELVRSVANSIIAIVAPVMLKVARLTSGSAGHSIGMNGFHEAVFVTLIDCGCGNVISIGLLLPGGAVLLIPNLGAWLSQNKPAIESSPCWRG